MTWFLGHTGQVWELIGRHALLAVLPLLIGLALALPLGRLARGHRALYTPTVVGAGLLYTIPSLALFILMPLILGTGILDPVNVVVTLSLYTLALLVRTVADALATVPADVASAAQAMGIGPLRRFLTVELPLAAPAISAGVRVAAVSNVSIVSVAALIGVPQLGSLFTDGFNRSFLTEIVVGILGCVLLALVLDTLIVGLTRLVTPWNRAARPRSGGAS